MAKKEIEIIDRGGAKVVAKKASFVAKIKITFAVFAVLWIAVVVAAPLYVKNNYSEPIKKSIVVGMFFDMQKQIAQQYENMLALIKKNTNIEKPINAAIEKIKVVDKGTAAVQEKTAQANKAVSKVSSITNKLGVNVKAVDKASNAIAKVDNTANIVNAQLDKVKSELAKTAQAEIDKMIDEEIRKVANKGLGGMADTLLTDYKIDHVYPWLPSSWPVANKIYSDLEKSSSGTLNTIMGVVNDYFGYVAWGLVVIAWLIGAIILFWVKGKVALITKPFIVCPRCGHAFADKRTGLGILKVFKPWQWI